VPGSSWVSALDPGAAAGARTAAGGRCLAYQPQRQASLDISPLLSPLNGHPIICHDRFRCRPWRLFVQRQACRLPLAGLAAARAPSSADGVLSGTGSTPGGFGTSGLGSAGLEQPTICISISSRSTLDWPRHLTTANKQPVALSLARSHCAAAGGLLPNTELPSPELAAQHVRQWQCSRQPCQLGRPGRAASSCCGDSDRWPTQCRKQWGSSGARGPAPTSARAATAAAARGHPSPPPPPVHPPRRSAPSTPSAMAAFVQQSSPSGLLLHHNNNSSSSSSLLQLCNQGVLQPGADSRYSWDLGLRRVGSSSCRL